MTRLGTTLIELLITLALLGIIASVTTLELRHVTAPPPDDPMTIINDTLPKVVALGARATLSFVVNGQTLFATINPDGSIVADSALHIDRFTGRRQIRAQ